MNSFAPCPKCNSTNSEQMSFTWWGGIIGPKILTHVKCNACSEQFNGKSGKSNTPNIIIYSVVVGIIVFVILALFIALVVGVTILK